MSARELRGQATRFLLVGGLNVALSYGIFILLGLLLEPWIAYTAGYLAGLALVAVMTPRFVFGSRAGWRRTAAFVGFYVALYLLGRLIVAVAAPEGLVELLLTSAMLLAVSVPLNFLAGRFLFRQPERPGAPDRQPGSPDHHLGRAD